MRLPYDIKPTTAENMFFLSAMKQTDMFSMTEVEKRDGKVFDFSNCTSFLGTFNSGCFDELNVIDLSKATSTYQIFYNGSSQARIKRINRLIFSEDTVISWGMFGYCTELEHVGFEGVISKSGLDMQWSTKLSKDSITSLVNALSPTTSGLTVTLSKTAVESAFPSEEADNYVQLQPDYFAYSYDGEEEYVCEKSSTDKVSTITVNGGSERGMVEVWFFPQSTLQADEVYTVYYNAENTDLKMGLYGYGADGMLLSKVIDSGDSFTFRVPSGCNNVNFFTQVDGSCSNASFSVSLKRADEWESLVATKPNWTISLV
jgi:hypothetical protein